MFSTQSASWNQRNPLLSACYVCTFPCRRTTVLAVSEISACAFEPQYSHFSIFCQVTDRELTAHLSVKELC